MNAGDWKCINIRIYLIAFLWKIDLIYFNTVDELQLLQTPKMHCYNFIIIHRNETHTGREICIYRNFTAIKATPHPLQRAIYRITCTLLLRLGKLH